MTAMAVVTQRIRFIPTVLRLAIRQPLLEAKSLCSVAEVSNGRVALGVGLAWMPEEFKWLNVDMKTRGKRQDEAIQALRLLMQGGFQEFHGQHIDFDRVIMAPTPKKKIPIYVGGATAPAMQRAARLGDGWLSVIHNKADIPALIARRSTEAVAAARALGATGEVINLGRVDGELDSSLVERGEVAFHIRRLQPQIVLGHDPWKTYRLHPDHRHAGYLAVEGIVAARDPHFFKEHGIPHHRPEALLLFEAEAPNHLESVEDRHLEARVQALLAHESQLETTHYHRLDDPSTQAEGFRVRERAVLAAMAEPFGEAIGEAFRLMDDL